MFYFHFGVEVKSSQTIFAEQPSTAHNNYGSPYFTQSTGSSDPKPLMVKHSWHFFPLKSQKVGRNGSKENVLRNYVVGNTLRGLNTRFNRSPFPLSQNNLSHLFTVTRPSIHPYMRGNTNPVSITHLLLSQSCFPHTSFIYILRQRTLN